MTDFLSAWHDAARTSAGLFWSAGWAFVLGYAVSSMIQVFVSRERMRRHLGEANARSMGLGTFFGFISSSCSFAALSTTRALFARGAALAPSLAFLLSSTNLVIELGMVIAVFLSWQFVVGEYVGGLLLIGIIWGLVRLTARKSLIEEAREHAQQDDDGDGGDAEDWRQLIQSWEGWKRVARRYVMEWKMVVADVTIGFAVAGLVAVFVPRSFFETLFVGSDLSDPAWYHHVLQAMVGPVAAFFTFIGSMGNIPLAAVLFDNGVGFAGVMAFIFSDLVVFPVLRIQARYYGWKMAGYILALFFVGLVATALVLQLGFAATGTLPEAASASLQERAFFALDSTFVLNLIALALTVPPLVLEFKAGRMGWGKLANPDASTGDRLLSAVATLAGLWILTGLTLPLFR